MDGTKPCKEARACPLKRGQRVRTLPDVPYWIQNQKQPGLPLSLAVIPGKFWRDIFFYVLISN